MDERFSRLRGFSDIYGDEAIYFEKIETVFREIVKLYGFMEIRLPVLERTDLFVRGIGLSTDIVSKEMFTFRDRGNRSVSLRPEGTASVVRAYLENNLLNDPRYQKLFYFGPMFRSERPQAGRLRQFHQVGVEYFGVDNPVIDFEVISVAIEVLSKLGLLNHMELAINSVGCESCISNYKEKLSIFIKSNVDKLCNVCKERSHKNILRVFDCKVESCKLLLHHAPKITNSLCKTCQYHIDKLMSLLSIKNIKFSLDESLVRGLDYYTRNVFEIRFSDIGAQNAVCGGGRYNHLVEEFGGPFIPAFGFAMGVERLILAMKLLNIHYNVDRESVSVCSVSDSELDFSIKVSTILRSKGWIVHLLSGVGKISRQMKLADKLSSSFTIVIGEDEVKSNSVSLKNMKTGKQEVLHLEELEKFF